MIDCTTADRTTMPDGRVVTWSEWPDHPINGRPGIVMSGALDGDEVAFMRLRACDRFITHCQVAAAHRQTGLGSAMYHAALLRYGSLASVWGRRCDASERVWAGAERRGWHHHWGTCSWRASGPAGLPPPWHPGVEYLTLAGAAAPVREPVEVVVREVREAEANLPGNNPWWCGHRIVTVEPVAPTGTTFPEVVWVPHLVAVVGDVLGMPTIGPRAHLQAPTDFVSRRPPARPRRS